MHVKKIKPSILLLILAHTYLYSNAQSIEPVVVLESPYQDMTVQAGQTIFFSATATDQDGTMADHWIGIRHPDGYYSFEGWLPGPLWQGDLFGNSFSSHKEGYVTLTDPGVYRVDTVSLDSALGYYVLSNPVYVTVTQAPTPSVPPKLTLESPSSNMTVQAGQSVFFSATALDADGTMVDHWIGIRHPAGYYSYEGWLPGPLWQGDLFGNNFRSHKEGYVTLTDPGVYRVDTVSLDSALGYYVLSNPVWVTVTPAAGQYCTPSYEPNFWNNPPVLWYNNCYNYSNNKRTDTFAQPGRANGYYLAPTFISGDVYYGTLLDGLTPTTASSTSAVGMTKMALVYAQDFYGFGPDYHFYRQGPDGTWSHKPGGTQATNLDNSGSMIFNPEIADRGPYTEFVGYFFTPAYCQQGQSDANIQ